MIGQPRKETETALILWPPLALAAATVLLSDWAAIGRPLKFLLPGFWLAVLAAGLFFLWTAIRRRQLLVALLLSAAAIVSAWAVLLDVTGRPDVNAVFSFHPDAWSYQCLAGYLYHCPRGSFYPNMPLADQAGSCMRNTRFGASALLAMLSHLPGFGAQGEVWFAQHALCWLLLMVHFFALVYFAGALFRRRALAIAAGVLGTAGGWLGNAVIAGNYDNLLFMALAPAWLGLAARYGAGRLSARQFAWAGALFLAAIFCDYPEGFALLSILSLPLLAGVCWRAAKGRDWALPLAAASAVFLLLVLPYLPTFFLFIQVQVHAGTQAVNAHRPGIDNFTGLLRAARALPAAFALGDEFPRSPARLLHGALGLCLCALAGLGAWTLRRAHPWFPWVAASLAGLWLWQDVWARYDYGTYKVILCASWWIYPALIAGLDRCLRRWGETAVLAGAALVLLAIAAAKQGDRGARVWQGHYALEPLSELVQLDQVIGHAPILLGVDDNFEYLWAIVFLRSHPIRLAQKRSYLAMAEFPVPEGPPLEDCRYELLVGDRAGALWHNARFSLVPYHAP
jgi:hypothetical protein